MSFAGGINLNPHSMAVPGHGREREHHYVYVEVLGPSTVDAHHNFVRRWNEVSERIACNGRWGSGSEDDRAFPTRLPKPCGAQSSEWGRSSDRAGCEDAEQVALFPLQPFVRRARLLHRSVVLDDPIVERLHDVRQ